MVGCVGHVIRYGFLVCSDLLCFDVLVGCVGWVVCWESGWPKVAVSPWLVGFPLERLLGSGWFVLGI